MQPAPNKSPVSRVLVDEQALRDRSPSLFQFNEKLLQDPNRLYQFKRFVEQEYADEHLSFYLVRTTCQKKKKKKGRGRKQQRQSKQTACALCCCNAPLCL